MTILDGRCQALGNDGFRCNNPAIKQEEYKGQSKEIEGEAYKYKLCYYHANTCRFMRKKYKTKCDMAKKYDCNKSFDVSSITDMKSIEELKAYFLEAKNEHSDCSEMREDHIRRCVYEDFRDQGHKHQIQSSINTASICLDNYNKLLEREKELKNQEKLYYDELSKKKLESVKKERERRSQEKLMKQKEEDILLDEEINKVKQEIKEYGKDRIAFEKVKNMKTYRKIYMGDVISFLTSVPQLQILYFLKEKKYKKIRDDAYIIFSKGSVKELSEFIYYNMSNDDLSELVKYLRKEVGVSLSTIRYRYGYITLDEYKNEFHHKKRDDDNERLIIKHMIFILICMERYKNKSSNIILKSCLDKVDAGRYDIIEDFDINKLEELLMTYYTDEEVTFFSAEIANKFSKFLLEYFKPLIDKYKDPNLVVSSIVYTMYKKGIIKSRNMIFRHMAFANEDILSDIMKTNTLPYLCYIELIDYLTSKEENDITSEKEKKKFFEISEQRCLSEDQSQRERLISNIIQKGKLSKIKLVNPDKYELLYQYKDTEKLHRFYSIVELLFIALK